MTDASLSELHRQLAALVNPQCHVDIAGMDEADRLEAIEYVRERIAEAKVLEFWDEYLKVME